MSSSYIQDHVTAEQGASQSCSLGEADCFSSIQIHVFLVKLINLLQLLHNFVLHIRYNRQNLLNSHTLHILQSTSNFRSLADEG